MKTEQDQMILRDRQLQAAAMVGEACYLETLRWMRAVTTQQRNEIEIERALPSGAVR